MAKITTQVDDEVKKTAEQVCDELGLSLSEAITIYLKKMAREKRSPIKLSSDPFYCDENIERLMKAKEQMEKTGGTIHTV